MKVIQKEWSILLKGNNTSDCGKKSSHVVSISNSDRDIDNFDESFMRMQKPIVTVIHSLTHSKFSLANHVKVNICKYLANESRYNPNSSNIVAFLSLGV